MRKEAEQQVSEVPAWVAERLAADREMAARRAAYDAWALAYSDSGVVTGSAPGWVAEELARREQDGSR
jgi:hypothetical protein